MEVLKTIFNQKNKSKENILQVLLRRNVRDLSQSILSYLLNNYYKYICIDLGKNKLIFGQFYFIFINRIKEQ